MHSSGHFSGTKAPNVFKLAVTTDTGNFVRKKKFLLLKSNVVYIKEFQTSKGSKAENNFVQIQRLKFVTSFNSQNFMNICKYLMIF